YLSSICHYASKNSYAKLKDLNYLFGITRPTFKKVSYRLEQVGLVEQIAGGNDFYLCHRDDLHLKGNYFFMHYSILRSTRITPRQKLIYSFLLSWASNQEKVTEVSMKTIAKNCAVRDDKKLRDDINILVSCGLITRNLKRKIYKGNLQYDKYQYHILKIPDGFFKESDKEIVEEIYVELEKGNQSTTEWDDIFGSYTQ
ncbi:hypothetical protein KIS1582_4750, partial [Cytobacillus firmus]